MREEIGGHQTDLVDEQEPPIGQSLCAIWARGPVAAVLPPVEEEGAMCGVSVQVGSSGGLV